MRTSAIAAALSLAFCLPPQYGKIILAMFTDSGYTMELPYRYYLTDDQNVRAWEQAIKGPVKVRVAPASEGIAKC
jgi:hypothetical protein